MVASPYRIDKGWTVSKIAKSQLAFIFIHLVVVASLIVFFRRHYSIVQIALMYLAFLIFFFSWKIFPYYLRNLLTPKVPAKNYVVIGRNEIALSIRRYYLMNPELRFRFFGYFDICQLDNELVNIRKYCVDKSIHEIIFCTTDLKKEVLQMLIGFGLDSLIKTRIVTSPVITPQTISFDPLESNPGLNYNLLPLDIYGNRFAKRTFDLVFSTFFILSVLSWLLPLIAVLIKIDSKGPVFFIQKRNGRGNRPFPCFKFRTMIVNYESDTKQATSNDSRVTKIGRYLRKSSIDELPQFLNVFIGDMSIIGPRPHPVNLNEKFAPIVQKLKSRHYVKPGITGLAQALGYRGETSTLFDMKSRITLDRFYIENWSFGLDMRIIYLTVISLIRGSEKAY
jgi:exopolysaccharide biosynthesis polyprenyl glycosylphosphotransferase